MTKLASKIAAFAILMGLATGLTGCKSLGIASEHSTVKLPAYPLDNQVADLGKPASLHISGSRGDQHYWTFNGSLIDSESASALGVTGFDTSTLTITKTALKNCGFYVFHDGLGNVSEASQLLVADRGNPSPRLALANIAQPSSVVVYGTPVAGGGGTGTACPGPYRGYVEYINYQTNSGLWAFPRGGTATDGSNANNTVVYYYGFPFTNHGCVPMTKSGSYYFYIFFKGAVPSQPYPLKIVMY